MKMYLNAGYDSLHNHALLSWAVHFGAPYAFSGRFDLTAARV